MNTKSVLLTSNVQLMRSLLVAFFAVFAVFAMSIHADAAEPQGVEGNVIKLKGNFEPGYVMPGSGVEPNKNSETPLAVPVHVFKGKLKALKKPDPKHPQLVKIVQADRKGRYKLPLPPGEYTVVAEIDGRLYLNRLDGHRNWDTVKVTAGKWAVWDIEDSSDASF